MPDQPACSRRAFLRAAAYTSAAGWAALGVPRFSAGQAQTAPAPLAGLVLPPSQVALTTGGSRADNVFRALKMIEPQIRQIIARKKRVLLKPNLVVVNNQLTATHVDCLEGILEFLRPLVKNEILLGDSPAGGQAAEGFDNYKYTQLQRRYNVKFIDFDTLPVETRDVVDHRYRPQPVRFASLLLDPDTCIISAAVPKTHDRAICTLSLKNVVVGAAIKDREFRWGANNGFHNDKVFIHGGPENQAIHHNLYAMAKILRPDVSVLDGYQGMEGDGPIVGTPVEHRVAVAATDFLAADRIGVELMGFDFNQVGYLTFCARAGLGQADLARIEVLGERVADHRKSYRPHKTFQQQLKWMTRA